MYRYRRRADIYKSYYYLYFFTLPGISSIPTTVDGFPSIQNDAAAKTNASKPDPVCVYVWVLFSQCLGVHTCRLNVDKTCIIMCVHGLYTCSPAQKPPTTRSEVEITNLLVQA